MISQFFISLITGIFIGGVAAYLGTLMLSKRMTLMVDPLGHLALPGAALALIYGFNLALGAFPFVVLGLILIWFLEIKTKLPTEALTAIVFSSGVAISFLLLPIEQAELALVGDVSQIGFYEGIISILIIIFVFWVIRRIYSKMVLINVSEDLAKSEGINVEKYNFIYLFLIAIIVALGVKMVGGLLTAALVAIPASTARNLSKNLSQYTLGAIILGAASSFVGILLFQITKFPAGPLIIITNALIFLLSIVFKNKEKSF